MKRVQQPQGYMYQWIFKVPSESWHCWVTELWQRNARFTEIYGL